MRGYTNCIGVWLKGAVLLALVVFNPIAHAQVKELTFVDMLWRVVDLTKLPLIEEGVRCAQFSSYDRASKSPDEPNWGANRDWGNYIRIEPNGEAVMAEIDGPGCIVRIWSANPQGKIRFYLDGAEQPIEFDFQSLFEGKIEPFIAPFCGYHGRGANCYLPIPFAKSCKVTADKPHGQYYHITYVTFPKDWRVETFKLPLNEGQKAELRKVAEILNRAGEDIKPITGVVERLSDKVIAAPGQRITLAKIQGSGIIRSLRLSVQSAEKWALRKLLLIAHWDDEATPSIWCPLGDFFGMGFQMTKYTSLPMGVTDNGAYCFFPMPFKKSARIEILNDGQMGAQVEFSIEWERDVKLPERIGYFHAKWRREAPSKTFDYPFIVTKGVGKYVGTMLNVDNPEPGWWGEGDEKVWVDDEAFPSTFGTGSEDYFGDAWGFRPFIHPLHGCILLERPDHAGKTSVYRWHMLDAIPFYKSLRFTIENYGTDKDYSSVAYWYQVEPHDDFFKPVSVAERLPWAKRIIGAIELEDVRAEPKEKVRVVVEQDVQLELSSGRALSFTPERDSDTLTLSIPIKREDVYELIIHSATKGGQPDFDVLVDGKLVGKFTSPFSETTLLRVGRVRMRPEYAQVQLIARVGGKQLLLDALELRQSPKTPRAIEAEALTVKLSEGAQIFVDDARMDWSSWAQLRIDATGASQWVELQLPKNLKGKFALSVRMTNGPTYGIVKFSIGGKEIGTPINCYAKNEQLVRETQLGIVELYGADANTIRCEVIGKDERSGGFSIGIDYFRLTKVLIEGAIEVEQMRVVKFERCRPGVQNMAPWGAERWSSENQLFCPGELGAYVTLEFDVVAEGSYELEVYFTKAPDYGIVEVAVDDEPVGKHFDGYSAQVEPSGKVTMGIIKLAKGKHTITFRVVGKNKNSTNYFMGIDCIRLVPKQH
ncbi:MAG: DUF2961 domain-containing protein [Armatimonadota bacterium]|nr:DUF2961 domain-containing protein [Armatimonadota bacterium]MDW8024466.1 DUF2961 domain-containing protein [Armatimonadota bacterium]